MISPKIRYAVREQVEMHVASLDDLLPGDHIVRDVWAYVEQMDLSALVRQIHSEKGRAGAPAFDPRTLMCLWLYATIDGVSSARRISRLCEESLVYRWISGGDVINYHTIASFRTDCAKALEDLLVGSLATLHNEGFLDLENMTVAHDGMRVRASAGRDSMRGRESLESSLARAREYWRELKEHDEQELPARKASARKRAARERVERLEKALEIMEEQEGGRKRTDRKPRPPRVSTTDPEAAMLRMANGGKDPAHNLQFTVETTARVVTSVHVPHMSSDTGTLCDAMEEHKRLHKSLPAQVLADQGFFKYSDIADLEKQGCGVHLPDLYPAAKTRRASKSAEVYIKKWLRRIAQPSSKRLYRERPSTAEWVNACARGQGLYQLPLRGRLKARTIALWHALAHNTRRTIALRNESVIAA